MTVPISPLRPDAPPLAILVDYDGTIALTDVTDQVLATHVPGHWEDLDVLYEEGRVGSRRLMERQIGLITAEPAALLATTAGQPHDPAFVPFVRRAIAAGIPVEIVSDGFGFFIAPAMDALGLPDVPIITAETTLDPDGPRIEFPNGHPECFVCGTCKRNRVLAHKAAGRAVVFIGDGESDRYAAGYSDVVFAKKRLIPICEAAGWPFTSFMSFAEIDTWLAETLDAWRSDPSAVPRPAPRSFFCGPEVWGPGRTDPPIVD